MQITSTPEDGDPRDRAGASRQRLLIFAIAVVVIALGIFTVRDVASQPSEVGRPIGGRPRSEQRARSHAEIKLYADVLRAYGKAADTPGRLSIVTRFLQETDAWLARIKARGELAEGEDELIEGVRRAASRYQGTPARSTTDAQGGLNLIAVATALDRLEASLAR